ncbi:glycine/D-amino acid oxidase-like deaminating enzyme [Pseudorhizobium tarimense]|uniref:Glycine/D-amino acid oxidase-like deaminating enzyme n=1 Tax=Pseudorhizobium tarimense TaxID=1079109 RepID=A0ABV2H6W4_9HYPH|nr:FAD-dependent oxidoreductase [Pseudorhizobium tarimense]MCJ8519491.1 FAD-binding oxidoreductase [Pseudorhizobium tarimense]
MTSADSLAGRAGQSLPSQKDLVIIGGGIMGLWAALKADRLGIPTLLLEADWIASGASGGLLGALMAHVPDRWNDKKQFQFDALVSLEAEIEQLELETGRSCGYRRSGRLIPLPKPHLREIALRHREGANENWRADGRDFAWNVLDASESFGLDPAFTEAGVVHETLAGRVSPRMLMSVLAERLRTAKHVTVIEGAPVARVAPEQKGVVMKDGAEISFGHCVVAAGPASFPTLDRVGAPLPRSLGRPVKGQAALLKAVMDPAQPVIFLNGLYVVPHDDGMVAVGSTSEEEFEAPFGTDEKLDDLIERARQLVPTLCQAEVVERWAGLRPKAIGREPMVGPHTDHPELIALTGGFKVSFGIAHRLADAALSAMAGRPMDVPASFTFVSHLALAKQPS